MTDVEIATRFAIASQFALLAVLLLRDHRDKPLGVLGALFAIAGVADNVDAPFGPRAGIVGSVFQFVSISGAVWFWLLAKALFDDAFRWRWSYLAVLLILEVAALGAYFYTDAYTLIGTSSALAFDSYKASLLPQQIMILALIVLVIYEAARDWRNDLVESRRRFRNLFLLFVSIALLWVSFSNYLQLGMERNRVLDAAGSIVGLVIIVGLIAALLRLRAGVFSETKPAPFPSAEPVDRDAPMIADITALMHGERLYAEHGLTIRALAERLREKEYRVRNVINGNMGYRNFNQFLNHHRLREATRMLTDEETRRLPVLSIALDVGYASLAPFNKAFKVMHGVTPTEYRRQNTTSGA